LKVLVNLKTSLETILKIKSQLASMPGDIFAKLQNDILTDLNEVIQIVRSTITDEPPIDLRNGGLIKDHVSSELDDLKNGIAGSKTFINKLEQQERERTGIGSLKVKFNQVFGYYIEITKSNLDSVPSDYYRKQTLVNAERFITPELKHHEEIILTAEEKIKDLEFKLFLQTTDKILEFTTAIQKASRSIAALDCLLTFAYISKKENYVCPELASNGDLEILEGCHPVVETLLDDTRFVPNDVNLNCSTKQLLIITGPNMAGKSVYIRQNALIVLMSKYSYRF
jgi:DNA mismatch repair protein MutS